MRRIALILTLAAGVCVIGIGLWLLIGQPDIDEEWMGVWVYEMEIGTPFDLGGAATIMGVLALVFDLITLCCCWLMRTHFVAAGILVLVLDMVACVGIAVCPDPRTGVFVWAVPGLLMAAAGFLLGMELQRTQKPDGVAELR